MHSFDYIHDYIEIKTGFYLSEDGKRIIYVEERELFGFLPGYDILIMIDERQGYQCTRSGALEDLKNYIYLGE